MHDTDGRKFTGNTVMARLFNTPHALESAVGERLGESGWLTIEQARIDLFAEATGDHQWICTHRALRSDAHVRTRWVDWRRR